MKSISLAIIGSGPAGLTASIYASRYRLENVVFGHQRGGTIGLAHAVENYPGFTSIPGLELMEKIEAQAARLGAAIEYDPVQTLRVKKGLELVTQGGKKFLAQALILATGTKRRQLNVPGEERLAGRGVSYCTTCDVPFFRDKTVALIGGSDAAVSGALHAADFARRVFIIYRGQPLRSEPIWAKQALAHDRIAVLYNTNVTEILGQGAVTGVKLDRPFEGEKELALEGVFIEIGGVPANELAVQLGAEVDGQGYLVVDKEMKTSLEGVFGAGDNTNFWPEFQQMVGAEAMGSMAATSAYMYLRQQKDNKE